MSAWSQGLASPHWAWTLGLASPLATWAWTLGLASPIGAAAWTQDRAGIRDGKTQTKPSTPWEWQKETAGPLQKAELFEPRRKVILTPRRARRPELTIENLPLYREGVEGPTGRRMGGAWRLPLNNERLRSFVSYLPSPFDEPTLTRWYSEARQRVSWVRPRSRLGILPRSASWYTTMGCCCEYRYSDTVWEPRPMEA